MPNQCLLTGQEGAVYWSVVPESGVFRGCLSDWMDTAQSFCYSLVFTLESLFMSSVPVGAGGPVLSLQFVPLA